MKITMEQALKMVEQVLEMRKLNPRMEQTDYNLNQKLDRLLDVALQAIEWYSNNPTE